MFNGVRYAARTGDQWRHLPHEYGPWLAEYQQMRRWLGAGVLEVLVADVQAIVREWAGRNSQPTAVCLDSRTLQSTPESGARAGYDGAKALCIKKCFSLGRWCSSSHRGRHGG